KPKPRRARAKKPSAGATANTSAPAATAPPQVQAATEAPNVTIGNKTVVPQGSAPETPGQISASMPTGQENQSRQDTARVLLIAENNLKSLNHVLGADEQAMVDQVRTFINQSHAATTEGDLVRASNLAQKAQLLSAELVK